MALYLADTGGKKCPLEYRPHQNISSIVYQAIEGLPGVRTVADDILISGESDTVQEAVEDHDKKLLNLLERCREKGVRLNKEKFKLKVTEIP